MALYVFILIFTSKNKNMRKCNAKTNAKHDYIMHNLREFDNLHLDRHISSLIPALKALGSLLNLSKAHCNNK